MGIVECTVCPEAFELNTTEPDDPEPSAGARLVAELFDDGPAPLPPDGGFKGISQEAQRALEKLRRRYR